MAKFFFILAINLITSSCSVYRSEGRKQFESTYSGSGSRSLLSKNNFCFFENKNDLNSNSLPKEKTQDLLLATNHFEIWRSLQHENVEVEVIENFQTYTSHCKYYFQDLKEWESAKENFLTDISLGFSQLELQMND